MVFAAVRTADGLRRRAGARRVLAIVLRYRQT